VLSSECSDGSFTKTCCCHHKTGVAFALGETIHFGSLEFIADRFGSLILSLEGSDSRDVFMGMVPSGPSSLDTILEESPMRVT
jgi:hypothetical protein